MLDDLRDACRESWDHQPEDPPIMERPDPTENVDDDKVLPWPPK